MNFINVIVHSAEEMNFRVYLQHEFSLLGLDDYLLVKWKRGESGRKRVGRRGGRERRKKREGESGKERREGKRERVRVGRRGGRERERK